MYVSEDLIWLKVSLLSNHCYNISCHLKCIPWNHNNNVWSKKAPQKVITFILPKVNPLKKMLCENWKMRAVLRSGMGLEITFTLCPLKSDHRLRTWLTNHHFLPGCYCWYSVASTAALQKYRLYAFNTGSSIFLLFSYFLCFCIFPIDGFS